MFEVESIQLVKELLDLGNVLVGAVVGVGSAIVSMAYRDWRDRRIQREEAPAKLRNAIIFLESSLNTSPGERDNQILWRLEPWLVAIYRSEEIGPIFEEFLRIHSAWRQGRFDDYDGVLKAKLETKRLTKKIQSIMLRE